MRRATVLWMSVVAAAASTGCATMAHGSRQTVTVVSDLVLEATTIIFDALGASSTAKNLGLDRYWRNARTIATHNPRVYRDRIVGDFAVNGTPPPGQYRIGTP